MDQQPGRLRRTDSRAELDTDTEVDEIEMTQIEIEQTRSEMSGTLEAIKEKLNPQMLMQQARDTVHGVTADLAQQAKDTVHAVTSDVVQQAKENLPQMTANAAHQAVSGAVAEAKEAVGDAVHTARDAGSSLMEMIERNPLPAALLATGLGWVWLNGRRQQRERQYWSHSSSRYDLPSRDSDPRRYDSPAGYGGQASVVDKAKAAVSDAAGTAKDAVGSAMNTARDAVGSAADTARDTGSTVMELIERNPLPVALLATSVGWLWMNARQQSGAWSSSDRGYGPQNSRWDESQRRDGEPAGVGAAVGQTLREAQDKVGAVAGQVQDKMGAVAGQVQDKVGAVADQVQQQAGQIGAHVQDQAHRTVDGFQRLLQQHPLSVGAMAMGLGAAVGLAVPETRREQQLMGETRDRLGEKVQHTAQELGLKAQIVVEEALGAVKEEAKNQGLTK